MNTPTFRRDRDGIKNLIKFLRVDRNLTLRQISEYIGSTISEVSRWSTGVLPRAEKFERLKSLADGTHTNPATGGQREVENLKREFYKEIGRLEEQIRQLREELKNEHHKKTA